MDNDCDGEVDEHMDQRTCGTDVGVCHKGVIPRFGRDGDGPCTVVNDPEFVEDETAAQCDGLDNDCDGQVDEGCVCEPDAEVCDGLDNDCDGQVDETCLNPSDALARLSPFVHLVTSAPWDETMRTLIYTIRTPWTGPYDTIDRPLAALQVRRAPVPISGWIGQDTGVKLAATPVETPGYDDGSQDCSFAVGRDIRFQEEIVYDGIHSCEHLTKYIKIFVFPESSAPAGEPRQVSLAIHDYSISNRCENINPGTSIPHKTSIKTKLTIFRELDGV